MNEWTSYTQLFHEIQSEASREINRKVPDSKHKRTTIWNVNVRAKRNSIEKWRKSKKGKRVGGDRKHQKDNLSKGSIYLSTSVCKYLMRTFSNQTAHTSDWYECFLICNNLFRFTKRKSCSTRRVRDVSMWVPADVGSKSESNPIQTVFGKGVQHWILKSKGMNQIQR